MPGVAGRFAFIRKRLFAFTNGHSKHDRSRTC